MREEQINTVFNQFDINNTGFITKENFYQALKKSGEHVKVNKQEIENFFRTHDKISYDTFKFMIVGNNTDNKENQIISQELKPLSKVNSTNGVIHTKSNNHNSINNKVKISDINFDQSRKNSSPIVREVTLVQHSNNLNDNENNKNSNYDDNNNDKSNNINDSGKDKEI